MRVQSCSLPDPLVGIQGLPQCGFGHTVRGVGGSLPVSYPSVLCSFPLSRAIFTTTTFADSCGTSRPHRSPRVRCNNIRAAPPDSTCGVFRRHVGFRTYSHAYRPPPASKSVRIPTVVPLIRASFSPPVTLGALRFSTVLCLSFRLLLFMLLVVAHAGHTSADVPVGMNSNLIRKHLG